MSCLPLWFCSVPGHRLERREARESSDRHPLVLHQPRRGGERKGEREKKEKEEEREVRGRRGRRGRRERKEREEKEKVDFKAMTR